MATQFSKDNWTTWEYLGFTSFNTPGYPNVVGPLPINSHLWNYRKGAGPEGSSWHPTPVYERQYRAWFPLSTACVQGSISSGPTDTGEIGTHTFRSRDELINQVSIRLDRKVRNINLDLGVTLGEIDETAAFIGQVLSRIAKSYRYARRGRIYDALRTLSGKRRGQSWSDWAADHWLAYQFALTPLMNDVQNAVKHLDGELLRGEPAQTVYSSISEPLQGKAEARWASGWLEGIEIRGTSKCSGKVTFVIDDWNKYTLEQIGLTNPIATAWELAPFSFVVDWFVPVGDYFRSLLPPAGVKFQRGYVVYKCSGKIRFYQDWDEASPGTKSWHTELWDQGNYKIRSALGTWPTVRLEAPTLDLSVGKVTSGIALLQKLLGGGSHPPNRRF